MVLTLLFVVTLFSIMMGTIACDEVRRMGRRVAELGDQVRELEVAGPRGPVLVPKQPRRVS